MFPVEIFQTTLSKLTVILRELGITFHLTGGLTGTAYGEPRMTHDIDVVIGPEQSSRQLDALVKCVYESELIYLIGGQLNAAGWNTRASGLPASLLAPQTDVRFFPNDDPRVEAADPSIVWGDLKAGSHGERHSRTGLDRNPCRVNRRPASTSSALKNLFFHRFEIGVPKVS